MDEETLKELRFAACASSVDIPGPLLQRLVSAYDAKKKRIAELEAFARMVRDGWDCDADAHRHGTICSVCAMRGDAWFTGITIGNWMFGVWHWPQRKRGDQ